MKSKGFSLWLMPSYEVHEKLKNIITALSTKFNSPKFEPHLTLLGQLDIPEEKVRSKTKQLSQNFKSFEIETRNINFQDNFFKCLFLEVESNQDLQNIHNKAQEIFNIENNFQPHISLLYSEVAPELKQKLIEQIGQDFSLKIKIGKILLMKTEGEVKEWVPVAEYMLK